MHNHILPAVKCNRTLWLGTSVLKSVNAPTMSAHTIALAIISLISAAVLASCDSMSSDFANLSNSFSPPTPAQAAQWALDPYDAENQRRGTVLLANAPWGGSPAYLSMNCPRCADVIQLPLGHGACPHCKLAIHIECDEPRCECGYLLHKLTGVNCPECGMEVPEKLRWKSAQQSPSITAAH